MKTLEEIERLAEQYVLQPKYDDKGHKGSFIKGYTQCQQDNVDKKYTEEDLRNAIREGRNSIHFENDGSWWEDETVEEEFIQSLNKKNNYS